MNLTTKRSVAVGSGVLFLILILLLKTVDVAAVGPKGTEIGLSWLNAGFHNLTGVKLLWYEVTEKLGYLALATAGCFAVLGLLQLLRRKSLLQVDREIIALGALFAVVIGLYVLFEVVIVNYRPIVMPGDAAPEASFPSSHTVLVLTVFGGAALILKRYVPSLRLRTMLQTVLLGLILVTVIGRLICGVHWLTDILGGILLSAALLGAFAVAIDG